MVTTTTLWEEIAEHFHPYALSVQRTCGETVLCLHPEGLLPVARFLRNDPAGAYGMLIDLCGVDWKPRVPRFDLVYHLYSPSHSHRVRLKISADETQEVESVVSLWPGAAWYEREIFDMLGIRFRGHADLRRILMPTGWEGHPLRKDYPLGGEAVAFTHNVLEDLWTSETPQVWLDEAHEDDLTAWAGRDAEGEAPGRILVINMGPQHPATHGLLRLEAAIDGERVMAVVPHIGYLHTGIEKSMEHLTYLQAVTLTDRLDYVAPLTNNLAYCLAVEKLLELEIPPRAQTVRVILSELTRIASHLLAIGSMALDVGVPTPLLYCFREREEVLDLFEKLSGVRMMTSFITIGGLRDDLPPGWTDNVRDFVSRFPRHIDEYDDLLTDNPVWLSRTRGIGTIDPETAKAYGLTGPNLRGSGIPLDLRKAEPYSGYDRYAFDIPTGRNGDVYDRYRVRMDEMRQSLRILNQALDSLPAGAVRAESRKTVPPLRSEMEQDMESLIHHFLLYSQGFSPPRGEAYASVEGPRGEIGFYVVSDGSPKPYRVKVRAPSFANLQGLPEMARGGFLADLVAVIGSVDPVMGEVDR